MAKEKAADPPKKERSGGLFGALIGVLRPNAAAEEGEPTKSAGSAWGDVGQNLDAKKPEGKGDSKGTGGKGDKGDKGWKGDKGGKDWKGKGGDFRGDFFGGKGNVATWDKGKGGDFRGDYFGEKGKSKGKGENGSSSSAPASAPLAREVVNNVSEFPAWALRK